jgi:hypothetical protein
MKMMNRLVLISLGVFFLVSCKSKRNCDYELISFYSYCNDDSAKEDSVVLTLKSNLYAQIYRDGVCDLIKFDYQGKITQFKRFQIDEKILGNAFVVLNSVNKDSTLVEKNYNRIYDGPTIRLVGKNRNGKVVNLSFEDSKESNLDLHLLYKYCDSNKETSSLSNFNDTLSILKSKDSLLKRIIIKVKKIRILFKIDDRNLK